MRGCSIRRAGWTRCGGVVVAEGVIADLGQHLARASALGGRASRRSTAPAPASRPAWSTCARSSREPGEEHKETFATASQAAAAGGVTSMVSLPNTKPVIDDSALVEFIARRARETSRVKIYTYAAVTRGLRGARSPRWACSPKQARSASPTARRPSPTPGDAARAGLCPRVRPRGDPAPGGAVARPERLHEQGRDRDQARPGRHHADGRGHHDRARPAAGRDHQRPLPRRPRLDRRRRSMRSAAPRRAACRSPPTPHRPISPSTRSPWATTAPSPRSRRRCAAKKTARP